MRMIEWSLLISLAGLAIATGTVVGRLAGAIARIEAIASELRKDVDRLEHTVYELLRK